MPNYNYGHFITEAINGILTQSRLPDELIIIDDASTDNSIWIIENLIKNFSFARLIKHVKNKGVLFSANEGIYLAKGDYLYFSSSDDIILPGFIEKMMRFIEEKQDMAICTSIPGFFKNNNLSKIYFYPMNICINKFFNKSESIKVFREKDYWIPGHSTFLKREYVLKYGGFDEKLKHHCDWFLNIEIALRHGFGYLSESLTTMRIHEKSFSSKTKKIKNEVFEIFNNIFEKIDKSDIEFKKAFKRSIVYNQLGHNIILHLFYKPKYWNYLMLLLYKKTKSFFKKIIIKKIFKIS